MKTSLRSIVYLLVVALVCCSLPAAAAYNVTSTDALITPPDNCGFVVSGSADGWIRVHLYNDDSNAAGRDLWVRAGQFYSLRVKDVRIDSSVAHPAGLTFDDSQSCGYTRSYGLDECNSPGYAEGYVVNYGGVLSNIGFFADAAGQIQVRMRSEGASGPWHTLSATAGEFFVGDIIDCQLLDGSDLTYLTALAP